MKKTILALLLIAAMLITVGCAKKVEITITFDNLPSFDLIAAPVSKNMSAGMQETPDGAKLILNSSADGDYPYTIAGPDGQQYSFTVQVRKGEVTVDAPDDGLLVNLMVK